jgi:predicted nucleic acid-binding Zn ribbon protein
MLTKQKKTEKLCKNCVKPIPPGEEIKIEKQLRSYEYSVSRSHKYSGVDRIYQWPLEKASYYLCRPCLKELEKEITKEASKIRKADIFWNWMFFLTIVAFVVALILVFWFKHEN